MADIQIVMEVVGEQSIVSATKSTMTLENKIKSLGKSLEVGRLNEQQFATGLKELRRTLDNNGKSWQANKSQIDRYVKSLNDAQKAQQATLAAQQAAKRQTQAIREMNVALAAQRKAQDENTTSLSRLRAGYDSNYAAEQRRLELKRRLRQEILNGNMTLREAGSELLKYRNHMQQFNMAQQAATKTSNRMGVVTQQAGYQIGDFLVQVQSGTNYMVAFGQQATQLVGILPLLAPAGGTFMGLGAGALIGLSAGLGVAIPLLTAFGAYFMRSGESADKAAEKIRTTTDVLKDLKEATKEATIELRLLQGAFKNALEIEAVDDIDEVTKKIEDLDARIAVVRQGALSGFGAAAGTMSGEELQALVNIGLDAQTESLQKEKETLEATLQKLKGKEKLVQIEEDYLALLEEVTEAEADAQASYKDRVKSLTIQNNLLRIQRGYGKDSVRESDYRIQLERERLGALRAQGLISQEQLDTEMKLVVEGENLTRGLTESEAKASALAEALKEAASAMSSLSGFSAGLDKALAVSVAKVEALKSGTDAAIAGTVAGMRIDLEAKRQAALAAGNNPLLVMAETALGESAIRDLEKSEAERKRLEAANRTSSKSGGGGGKTEAELMAERIAKFEEQLRLEEELNGKTEARKRIIQALGVEFVQKNAIAVAGYEADINALNEINRLEQERKQIMDTVESSIESGFMAMVDGTKSVKDAFKDMAREIIKELYRVLVVQRLVGAISGAIGGIGGGSSLAPTTSLRPPVKPFANGGVVSGPTMFPMSGGQTGLMGEAGPEAIMPLKRDKSGRLGVSVEGGSGSVVVNNNINVTGGTDPAAIRMEVAKLMPQITNATKTAVIDARRRGGQMKAAFG